MMLSVPILLDRRPRVSASCVSGTIAGALALTPLLPSTPTSVSNTDAQKAGSLHELPCYCPFCPRAGKVFHFYSKNPLLTILDSTSFLALVRVA